MNFSEIRAFNQLSGEPVRANLAQLQGKAPQPGGLLRPTQKTLS